MIPLHYMRSGGVRIYQVELRWTTILDAHYCAFRESDPGPAGPARERRDARHRSTLACRPLPEDRRGQHSDTFFTSRGLGTGLVGLA